MILTCNCFSSAVVRRCITARSGLLSVYDFYASRRHNGRQRRDVLRLSLCASIRSYVTRLVEMIFWKPNEPISMPIGTLGPRGKGMKHWTLTFKRSTQSSRSHKAKDRFGGQGHVQQLTSRIDRTIAMFDRSAVGQLSSLSGRTK